jgi:YidC/Oxa1 family membrane protein insertase
MTNLLVALARVFGGNFGIAIIIFTLGMRFATWPLTASQYRASRAMSALQPKVQELQKKYKGKDPKKLQAETMALYREAGVNPLGCVFPMLIQMPIWIALYQVIRLSLGTAPESLITLSQRLYPIPFVHTAVPLSNRLLIWDLGQPDTTYILPVIVGITMYVQQKMITPAPTAATANSQQAQTQQMMTWMMPLMFFIMSLNFPSGLALYWAVSQVAGIIMQYFYMGRTFDWKNMLTINPPPQQPQRRAPRPQPALVPAQDEEAEEHPAAAAGGARRKRHGRRRGKR